MTLSDLNPGEAGIVMGFQPGGDLAYRQKLLTMGLTPQTRLLCIRRAPLGDPIEIRVRDYHLSLRQSEASILLIRRATS